MATRGTSVRHIEPAARACDTRRTSSRANRVRPAVGPTQFASPRIASSCSTADRKISDVAAEWAGSLTAHVAGTRAVSMIAISCRVTLGQFLMLLEILAVGDRIELHRDIQMPNVILLPSAMMRARHRHPFEARGKRSRADGLTGGAKLALHLSFSDAARTELDGNDARDGQASAGKACGQA